MTIRAVVFDMDGVIVDSEPYSMQALVEVLREYGIEPTTEDLRRSYGRGIRDDFEHYFRKYRVSADIEVAMIRKHARYFRLADGHLRAFAGVRSLIERLRKGGYRVGLASSGSREKVQFGMTALGLGELFKAIVSGDDVTQSKPHPEIYLLAAQRLGMQPSACVAIEDAPAGIEAAKRAGMRCIAVTNSVAREQLQAADLVVDSLENDLSPLLSL